MPQPEASADFYRTLQRLQVVVVGAGRRAWSRMGPDFDRSWAEIAPSLMMVTAASQLAAARAATEYVPAVLAEVGSPVDPEARVQPRAFAGVAADGRSLPGLLRGAVVHAKNATRTRAVLDEVDLGEGNTLTIRRVIPGRSPEAALDLGGRWLDALLQSVVTDAGRGATQAEIAVRPGVGFIRRVNPPSCGRCAILAGRWYKFDAGFSRHPPTCDCTVEPATEADAHMQITDPSVLFDNGLVHGLTKRERARLDAGEDRNKVINETRDMWRAKRAEQKAAAKQGGGTVAERDARARQGLEDLFASTRTRVDALNAMKAQGYAT